MNWVGDGAWVGKGEIWSKKRMGEMGQIYVSEGRLGLCRSAMEEERNSEWRWREKVRRETYEKK